MLKKDKIFISLFSLLTIISFTTFIIKYDYFKREESKVYEYLSDSASELIDNDYLNGHVIVNSKNKKVMDYTMEFDKILNSVIINKDTDLIYETKSIDSILQFKESWVEKNYSYTFFNEILESISKVKNIKQIKKKNTEGFTNNCLEITIADKENILMSLNQFLLDNNLIMEETQNLEIFINLDIYNQFNFIQFILPDSEIIIEIYLTEGEYEPIIPFDIAEKI